jgi:Family of unknown function (DUF6062)
MDLDDLLTRLGVWRTRRTSKFVAYAHLLDACPRPGCPVCRCLDELTRRALDAFLHEHVTDPASRGRLDRSDGFCAWHGELLAAGGSAAGAAIVCESVLGRVAARLRQVERELTTRRRPSAPPSLAAAQRDRTPCPLCADMVESEAGYLRTVLDFVTDGEFEQAYTGSSGLCRPHLELAVVRFPGHRGAAPLVAVTLPKLERLAADLAGLVRKHGHQAEAPPTPGEATAWTDAIRFLTGAPGLFGNQLARSEATRAPRADATRGAETSPSGPADLASAVQARLDALAFDKAQLEQRVGELTRELGEETSRAAGLLYRLRLLEEDRKVLEMNLAGERGAARTWERQLRELETEVTALRQRLASPDPAPTPIATDPAGGSP